MEETKKQAECSTDSILGALRYLSEASYAILPKDIAHQFGELKKNFWSGVRSLIDKELEWIDESVAGGDRLREEWRSRADRERAEDVAGSGI